MTAPDTRAPKGAVLERVLALLAARPDGMTLGEISAAVGKGSDLMCVLLRQYVERGRLIKRGQRPNTRYLLGGNLPAAAAPASTRAVESPKVVPPAPAAPDRRALLAALRGLLAALGIAPEDLREEPPAPAPLQSAERQLVTPAPFVVAPAPVPVATPARTARPPGPKPLEPRPYVHVARPQRKEDTTAVVIPEGVKVKQCPSGRDTRFTAEPGSFGGGFLAEWQRLRGGAA